MCFSGDTFNEDSMYISDAMIIVLVIYRDIRCGDTIQ